MALTRQAAETLAFEARALATRLAQQRPFALSTPRVAAAAASPAASAAIEHHLSAGRRKIAARISAFERWLHSHQGRSGSNAEAQKRFAFLKLRMNAVLTQIDIFADALLLRSEQQNGVWLAGLDAAAEDALRLEGRFFESPPVITYLDRGHGAAIRRARTRLPGGEANPVAIVRIPRERMVGSGIASSLVHEVGHQGAALLDLVASLRGELQLRERRASDPAERLAWSLWARWISEIVADFWSVAQVGVSATQGLIGVVSLPRAFVFRVQLDAPHPFPWIRVKLSAALGERLYPDPQWRQLGRLWESFYPRRSLGAERRALLAGLERSMPSFIALLLGHRPPSLRGRRLVEVFPTAGRQPDRLRRLWRQWGSGLENGRRLSPALAFAVIGQAKQDRRLEPGQDGELISELLESWALRRAVPPPKRVHAPAAAA